VVFGWLLADSGGDVVQTDTIEVIPIIHACLSK